MKSAGITRRLMIGGGVATLTVLGFGASRASPVIGTAVDVRGAVNRRQQSVDEKLASGASLMDNDTVVTGTQSFADLLLGKDTRILLGSDTELLIDSFIAGQGGTLELGAGRMVFDRPEGLAKIDLNLRTTFGMIGVRGTKFFCGPNRGNFAVFVEHGLVTVSNAGVTRDVGKGEGVEIAAPDAAPAEVKVWGAARIREAYASAGITAK